MVHNTVATMLAMVVCEVENLLCVPSQRHIALVQKMQAKADALITGQPDSNKPFSGAKLYKRAVLGPLLFGVGDVVELEDDDESSELPLLGLVQCIFEGEEASDVDIQVWTSKTT